MDFASTKETLVRDPLANDYYSALRERADGVLDAAPSYYQIPDPIKNKPHILWISRQVLDRVYALALLYRLDGAERYAERAWEELRAAAGFPDWHPEQFLGTAEMTHAFAIGYDWLYDALTSGERGDLRAAVMGKGLEAALKAYRDRGPGGSWVGATNNWNLVCNGGIGLGALAIKHEMRDRAEDIDEVIDSALRSLEGAMARFAPDGGWEEGLTYWGYGTYYATLFLAALMGASGKTSGATTGLLSSPGFSETGFFPLYLTGPTARAFNFADSATSLPQSPQLFWHSREFDHPVLGCYQRRIGRTHGSPHALDLLWYVPPAKVPRGGTLPLDRLFRGTGVATFRSAWEDPEAVFLGFKAGDNRASHGHLDQGSFVLDALGTRWALDLGAADYDVPAYEDDRPDGRRWAYYRARAEGHNTLVINPGAAADQDPEAASRIARFYSGSQRAFVVADLTPAYRPHAHKVWRGVVLLDRRQVLVQDEVEAINPAQIWWFMHTGASGIQLLYGGTEAMLTQGSTRLWARILSPQGATFTTMDARPLPSSPDPAVQGQNEGVRKLAITFGGIAKLRLSVMLVPLGEDEAPPSDLPGVGPLAEW